MYCTKSLPYLLIIVTLFICSSYSQQFSSKTVIPISLISLTLPSQTLGVPWLEAAAKRLMCWLNDGCCKMPWLQSDISGLEGFLRNHLYGQHLAIDPIIRSLRGHLHNKDPEKALVLSLHGSTGNGKNYISNAIARYLYQDGMDSQFVHLFVTTKLFPHVNQVHIYQDQLRSWISGNTSVCHRNLFIFDEIDRMPPGVLDAIKPFLDHYRHIQGVNYRRNIFLFLGNTAGKQINQYTLDQWRAGRPREGLTLREFEPIISKFTYNDESGLWHSRLIDHGLVSAYIPFLPMERQHVEMCIRDYLRKTGRRVSTETVNAVADELDYAPDDLKLISTTGCKRVADKVELVLQIQRDEF